MTRPSGLDKLRADDPYGAKACGLVITYLNADAGSDANVLSMSFAVGDYAIRATTPSIRHAARGIDTSALVKYGDYDRNTTNVANLKEVYAACKSLGVDMPAWNPALMTAK